MNTQDITHFTDQWLNDVKQATKAHFINETNVCLATPFTDPFDDQITLLITALGEDYYRVSDQGYTLWNLTTRGISFNEPKALDLRIEKIIRQNHVLLDDNDDLYVDVSEDKVAQGINDVLNSVMQINGFACSPQETHNKNSCTR